MKTTTFMSGQGVMNWVNCIAKFKHSLRSYEHEGQLCKFVWFSKLRWSPFWVACFHRRKKFLRYKLSCCIWFMQNWIDVLLFNSWKYISLTLLYEYNRNIYHHGGKLLQNIAINGLSIYRKLCFGKFSIMMMFQETKGWVLNDIAAHQRR